MRLKKIKMPKIFTEFKEFITRGNVMGLAVGMIIGAAFTAIVNALVNSILKPLINAIPIGDGISGLITMLVPRDAEGAEIAMSLFQADPTLADLTKPSPSTSTGVPSSWRSSPSCSPRWCSSSS